MTEECSPHNFYAPKIDRHWIKPAPSWLRWFGLFRWSRVPTLLSRRNGHDFIFVCEVKRYAAEYGLTFEKAELKSSGEILTGNSGTSRSERLAQLNLHDDDFIAIYSNEQSDTGWYGYRWRYTLRQGPKFGLFPEPKLIRVIDAKMLLGAFDVYNLAPLQEITIFTLVTP